MDQTAPDLEEQSSNISAPVRYVGDSVLLRLEIGAALRRYV